ncbi:MAG TPA: ParB N-terminal domain-containing protein [Allosphingosinicella sp.]|nr:ParB N-terminal domain-containing protein [Allosphingosinicella sp.]
MKLDYITLDRLSVSPANMRARQKADIANILPSVRQCGVLVPLLVRPNGGPDAFEIVAGRRRFLAAKAVAEEGGEAPALPCGIIEAGDDAAALEASLIENFARLDPDEVTQWETFARLVKEGRGIDGIAATFGVTERLVRRILALGNLLPRIRTLYRQELIDAGTIRHLTLATKAQQREWLTLYDSPDSYAPTGRALKEWLFGGQAIPTTAAIFDLSEYTGAIVADLFGEDSYFADSDAFWTLQRAAVEAKKAGYLEAGWSAVEVLAPGAYFQQWEYEKRGKSKGGRVYIALSARGEVEVHEGWLPRKEARKADKGEVAPKATRPEITRPLQNYIDLHRHAAVRAELLNHPGVALRLMVAHAITGSGLWSVRPDPQRADKPGTAESVETCVSESRFDEKRRAVLALLAFDAETPTVVRGGSVTPAELFQRLVPLSDEDVLAVLALAMAETLEAGSEVVETIGAHLDVDMAAVWQPDDAFFDLIHDKALLTKMVAEVAGEEVAAANAGEKGKVLKGIVRDCLARTNGRLKTNGWTPTILQFDIGNVSPLEVQA